MSQDCKFLSSSYDPRREHRAVDDEGTLQGLVKWVGLKVGSIQVSSDRQEGEFGN